MLLNKHNSLATFAILLALVGIAKPEKAFSISQSDLASQTRSVPKDLSSDADAIANLVADTEINSNLQESSTLDPDLQYSGAIDPNLGDSGAIDTNLQDSGAIDPNLEDSGAIDPDLQDSGVIDPILEDSGEPLSAEDLGVENKIAEDEIVAPNTVEDSEIEVAEKKNNWWWWLIPLLGIPLLAVIIAIGGGSKSDREPAIDRLPNSDDPDGGIGIADPADGDGGNLSRVGSNSVDGGIRSTMAGGTALAGSANVVSDRRPTEPNSDLDLDLDWQSSQTTSLVSEDLDLEQTESAAEIPSDSVSEFTGQETKLQVSSQSTVLQTDDELSGDLSDSEILGEEFPSAETAAIGGIAGSNLIGDRTTVDNDTTNTVESDLDSLRPMDLPTTEAIVDRDVREMDFEDAVAENETTKTVGKEFRGDFVLEEETRSNAEEIGTLPEDSWNVEPDLDLRNETISSQDATVIADAAFESDSETIPDLESIDAETDYEGVGTISEDSWNVEPTIEPDLDLSDETINSQDATVIADADFESDSETIPDLESMDAETDFDRESGNVIDLRQDNYQDPTTDFNIDDDSITTSEPDLSLADDDDSMVVPDSSVADRASQLSGAERDFLDRDTSEIESIDAEFDTEAIEISQSDRDTNLDPNDDIFESRVETNEAVADSEVGLFNRQDNSNLEPVEQDLDVSPYQLESTQSDRLNLADDAIASTEGLNEEVLTTEEITFDETDDTVVASIEDIAFDESSSTQESDLEDITFDENDNVSELTLEEITFDENDNVSELTLEEITFDENDNVSELTLEDITFDETDNVSELTLEDITFDENNNVSELTLEEITFDENNNVSELTLEEITFDENNNANNSLDDAAIYNSEIDIDELGFAEVESTQSNDDSTSDLLRDNTADIASLSNDDSEDLDNISEWLESLETPKQNTENISEWLKSLNADESRSDEKNSELEEADDISFQFLEDLLEKDSDPNNDER